MLHAKTMTPMIMKNYQVHMQTCTATADVGIWVVIAMDTMAMGVVILDMEDHMEADMEDTATTIDTTEIRTDTTMDIIRKV